MSKRKLLSYHLTPLEGAFTFQIVQQDDRITNFIKRVGVYEAKNGWRVTIDRQPEIALQDRVIYLRGKKANKDEYVHRNMNVGSNKEVKKILSAIDSALIDLARDAKGGSRRPFKYYDQVVIDLREADFFPFCGRADNRIIIVK